MIGSNNSLHRLPESWVWVSLGEILSIVKGKKPDKLGAKDEFLTIPYVNITAFEKKVFNQFTDGNGCALCEPDNVLIVWDGARCGLVGKGVAGAVGSTLAKLVHYELNFAYLFHFLQTKYEYINSRPRGVGIPHVEPSVFWEIDFPLSPLPEQHRIVAKVEELFTRLDAGVEGLKKVKAQLKGYRRAVLKHAFEGKLTKEWREAHNGEMEPASVLLERIKEKRKKNTKRKYKELPVIDESDFPELPESWVWTRVGVISKFIQYGTSEKATKDDLGIPVLRMGNIKDGKLIFDDLKYFPKEWSHLKEYILQDGDVLFNRTNSVELVGKTAVYKSNHPAALFASYLIRVQVDDNAYISDILAFFINSFYGRKYIASVVSQQVGQANVNGTKLSLMPVPLLPLPEQRKIVEEIERHFSVADQIEQTAEQSLIRAERLRQSILKRAFEGKLVPQDPNDEPAEKLLERIKAEKVEREAEKKAAGRGRKGLNTIQGRLM